MNRRRKLFYLAALGLQCQPFLFAIQTKCYVTLKLLADTRHSSINLEDFIPDAESALEAINRLDVFPAVKAVSIQVLEGADHQASYNQKGLPLIIIPPIKGQRATIQHEYGHVLLQDFLSRSLQSPDWIKFFKTFRKEKALRTKRYKVLKNGHRSEDEVARKYSNLTKQIEALSLETYEKYSLMEPMEELFADLLVVAESGDPRIMHQASREIELVEVPGRSPLEWCTGRDFTAPMYSAAWEKDVASNHPFPPDPHILYDPVRSHLWSHYLSREPYKSKPVAVVQAVARAIRKEIEVQAKSRQLETPHAKNIRLILAIDQEVATSTSSSR